MSIALIFSERSGLRDDGGRGTTVYGFSLLRVKAWKAKGPSISHGKRVEDDDDMHVFLTLFLHSAFPLLPSVTGRPYV